MTRDDILRMGSETDLFIYNGDNTSLTVWLIPTEEKLFKFAALVAAAEREACAKVCESLITDGDIYPGNFVLEACAKSIRSKSE